MSESEVIDAFKWYDTDKDGKLTFWECRLLVHGFGYMCTSLEFLHACPNATKPLKKDDWTALSEFSINLEQTQTIVKAIAAGNLDKPKDKLVTAFKVFDDPGCKGFTKIKGDGVVAGLNDVIGAQGDKLDQDIVNFCIDVCINHAKGADEHHLDSSKYYDYLHGELMKRRK